MRKILAVVIGLAFVPSAHAETTLSAKVQVTPSNAGTEKRPQGVKLTIGFDLTTLGDAVHPMITGLEVWHGPGLTFDRGKGYAECSQDTLARVGPDGCPQSSIVGRGSSNDPDETVEASPKLVIVNGPGRVPLAYVTLQRPARVRAVAPFAVVRRPRSAWPNRMSLTFPETLRVVAGIPITIDDLKLSYGYTKAAKLYVATTSCPKGGWRWRVRVHTYVAPGNAPVLQQDGRAPCTTR